MDCGGWNDYLLTSFACYKGGFLVTPPLTGALALRLLRIILPVDLYSGVLLGDAVTPLQAARSAATKPAKGGKLI